MAASADWYATIPVGIAGGYASRPRPTVAVLSTPRAPLHQNIAPNPRDLTTPFHNPHDLTTPLHNRSTLSHLRHPDQARCPRTPGIARPTRSIYGHPSSAGALGRAKKWCIRSDAAVVMGVMVW